MIQVVSAATEQLPANGTPPTQLAADTFLLLCFGMRRADASWTIPGMYDVGRPIQ